MCILRVWGLIGPALITLGMADVRWFLGLRTVIAIYVKVSYYTAVYSQFSSGFAV